MSAAIRRFVSRPELLQQHERTRVRDLLADAGAGLPLSPLERQVFDAGILAALGVVDRLSAGRNERSFIMLYPAQNRLVVEYLSRNSKWPHVAGRLWAWLFELVRMDDGEILVTREGLIERVGCSPRAVDGVLKELVDFGALIRLRESEPGKRGRGTVRYFMNPRVGTHLKGAAVRDEAQRSAPLLKLIDGTEHPSQRRSRAPVVALPVL